MNTRRDLIPTIFWAVAGVAAAVGIGLWIYFGALTIYTSLILVVAVVCAGIAAYLKPEPLQAVTGVRQVREGGNVLTMVILLGAILLIANMILNPKFPRPSWLAWLPTWEKQWDVTASKQYSLSPETINILKTVQEPIEILAFYSSNISDLRDQDRPLLENYTRYNPLVTLQWLDPVAQPTLAQKYGVTYDAAVVFQAGERRQTAEWVEEAKLTSALIKVMRVAQPVVYFTAGHNERQLDDSSQGGYNQAKSALENSGYQVRALMTAVTGTIPADASVVVIAGPRLSFTPRETDVLRAYLARGGKLAIMLDVMDPQQQPDTLLGLGALLDEWGVTMRSDVVVDTAEHTLLSSNMTPIYIAPLVAQYGYSPITSKLSGPTAFVETRSITQTRVITGVWYTALAQSSSNSWSVSDLAEVESALKANRAPQPGEKDARGALTLAASLENTQTQARLVIFGTSTFAANAFAYNTVGRDLFLNAVNWLSAQSGEDEFQLPPKASASVEPMQPMTLGQFLAAGFVSVCLLPIVVAAAGVWVWWRRR